MAVPVFYLGPLGRLVPLVSPDEGVSRTDELSGHVHQSINAAKTLDVRGYRRIWEFDQAWLEPDALSYLQTCFIGVIQSPLRFVDPINKNRLSKSTSAASRDIGWSGGYENWDPAVGTARSMYGPTPTASLINERGGVSTYMPETFIRWETATSGDLFAERDRHDQNQLSKATPVFPGETLTLSAYVRRISGVGEISMTLKVWDSDATPMPGAVTTDPTDSPDWVRLTATINEVPAAGVATMPVFTTDGFGVFDIAQVQLEEGPEATNWHLGNGCPEVLFTELQEQSPRYPLVTASLILEET